VIFCFSVQGDMKCTDASGMHRKSWRVWLHWTYCQNNTTVWTDSRKEAKINHLIVYGSDYTESDLTGVLSPNSFLLSGPAK